MERPAFVFTIQRTTPRMFEIEYAGHMPEDDAHVVATREHVLNTGERVGMLYFVERFSSFHPSQVQRHGSLFAELRPYVRGIAVVKPQAAVRFGAITVGLLSKTPLKTFDDRETAVAWLDGLS